MPFHHLHRLVDRLGDRGVRGAPGPAVLFLGVVLCGLAALPADAHTYRHARCLPAAGPLTVDGSLDEWAGAESVRVTHAMVSYGEAPRDDADASYVLYTLWDSQHLYVGAEVRDDSLAASWTGQKLYENDCLEVCFDALHDSQQGIYDADDFQFVFSIPVVPGGKPLVRVYRNPAVPDADVPEVSLGYRKSPGGYVLEAAIPWKLLGLTKLPVRPYAIGFQNSLRDRDADGSAAGLCWLPLENPAASPIEFGHLVLVDGKDQDLVSLLDTLQKEATRHRRLAAGDAEESDGRVSITLGGPGPHRLSRGIGWNVQFYDGHLPPWSEADWQAFLALLRWSRPAWVRYGINLGQWEPENDDGDPFHFEWPHFRFDTALMSHHCRMLDFFEAEGIEVMLCNWYVGDPASGATWLSELRGKPGIDPDHAFHLDAPAREDEFVESLAALVHYLKVERKYSCVKLLSLWNEPDGHWTYRSPQADYPRTFWPLYGRFLDRLRALGLEDSIGLAGPDTATESYHGLLDIPRLLETYQTPLALLADHDYSAFFDHHRPGGSSTIAHAVRTYSQFLEEVDASCGRLGWTRPEFAVTEYGNGGNGPGPVEGDAEVHLGSLSLQEFVLRTLPLGISGYLRWEFKPYGLPWQNFGALTRLERGYRFAPYPPVFYAHALLARTSRRGGRVLNIQVEGGADELGFPRVYAAALLPADNHLTVWLTNSGRWPRDVEVRLGPWQDAAARLAGWAYTLRVRHGYEPLETRASEGSLVLTLPPRSLAVLTTLENPVGAGPGEAMALAPRLSEPVYQDYDVGGFPRTVVSFPFEEAVEWEVWRSSRGRSGVGLSAGATGEGNRHLVLTYDFVSGDAAGRPEHLVATTPVDLPALPLEVSVRIHGEGSSHVLSFLFVDDRGETFEAPAAVEVSWQGWKTVGLELPGMPMTWHSWGEHRDGILDFPLRGVGFQFHERDSRFIGRGSIFLDDLRILARPVVSAKKP
ncbi:MAG: hypothetical protein HYU36_13585 [Planctomycetes bacterium]|nr:hypothetical protein [Planctomycetota bacterium]